MEDTQNNVPQQVPPISPSPAFAAQPPQSSPDPKPFYKKTWFIILAVFSVLIFVVYPAVGFIKRGTGSEGKVGPGGKLFYSMVENTAQKTKLRYAYEMESPNTEEKQGKHYKAISEYDYAQKQFSTVYAGESFSGNAGRCVKGQEYRLTTHKSPDNLKEAEENVQGPAEAIPEGGDPKGLYEACEYTRTRYQSRFTDGLLPVGLTAEQAKGMVDGLKDRDFIIFTDEGKATFKGKEGRKVGFEVSQQKTGKAFKAEAFFHAYRDGNTGKSFGNGIVLEDIGSQFAGSFYQISPQFGIKGFYLIDEKTKLPIYSEFTTTADGLQQFVPDSVRQSYEYPEALTMNQKTPLEALPKLQ